jgi:4-hydroxybenzoyl-CoA thioesterase
VSASERYIVNRRTVHIGWGDCDAAQIVYYPNYFRWMDQGTGELFERVGLSHRAIREINGVGIPLVDAQARFLVSSSYGDDLQLDSTVAEWRKTSFKVSHRFYDSSGTLAAEGTEVRVWAMPSPENPFRIRTAPIPREIIERFARSNEPV